MAKVAWNDMVQFEKVLLEDYKLFEGLEPPRYSGKYLLCKTINQKDNKKLTYQVFIAFNLLLQLEYLITLQDLIIHPTT